MKIKVFLPLCIAAFFLCLSSIHAQNGSSATGSVSAGAIRVQSVPAGPDSIHHLPGRGLIGASVHKSYPDSVQFKKSFEEFYALTRPQEPIMIRLQKQYKSMYPMYRKSGVDSVEGWKAILRTVDTTHERTLVYNFYREIFTAEDLRTYTEFLRTPAGKKFQAAQPRLGMIASDASTYPSRVVSIALSTLVRPTDPAHEPHPRLDPHGINQAPPPVPPAPPLPPGNAH